MDSRRTAADQVGNWTTILVRRVLVIEKIVLKVLLWHHQIPVKICQTESNRAGSERVKRCSNMLELNHQIFSPTTPTKVEKTISEFSLYVRQPQGECQCEGQADGRLCPNGQRWDEELCGCVCAAQCPRNQPLNPDTCMCQCRESPQSCLRQGKKFNYNTCR